MTTKPTAAFTRRARTRPGGFPVAAFATTGLNALWLAGVAIAGGTGLPIWVPFAASCVLAVTTGVCWALTQLSHGGPWGWARFHQSRTTRTSRER